MKLFSKKTSEGLSDKAAAILAGEILCQQRQWALRLNAWFNTLSTRQKKGVLVIVGLITAILLITGIASSFYHLPAESPVYNAPHIGLPSGVPQSPSSNRQLTDSLTIKK